MARRKKQDEDPSQENVNNTGDDTFGLPEIEYQPLQREESPQTSESPSQPTSQETSTPTEMEREEIQQNEYNPNAYYENDDDNNSPWPKILGIAAILLVIGAGVWYFGVYRPKQLAAAEKVKLEQEAAAAKQREADLALQKQQEDERRRADSLASIAAPAVGVIDTLTERTGRYYVIIASAIDGDLIADYAKKLAPKGLSPKIIPPFGKVKFYRLAIAEGDTYASTQATADQLKSEYTGGAWVVKY
jgi:hypothetical protein